MSIWGEAVPNSDIKIFSEWGQELKIKSNTDGSWIGKLSTPDAGGPFYLKINSAKETLIIRLRQEKLQQRQIPFLVLQI